VTERKKKRTCGSSKGEKNNPLRAIGHAEGSPTLQHQLRSLCATRAPSSQFAVATCLTFLCRRKELRLNRVAFSAFITIDHICTLIFYYIKRDNLKDMEERSAFILCPHRIPHFHPTVVHCTSAALFK
jgi:hypothetical protein